MLPQLAPAVLALADGSVFHGHSIGAPVQSVGEVVFNTALTGYQEILTDPSYSGQIVTLTYPHIGNTGVNPEDVESGRVHAAGLVVRDCPALMSNFRATQSLPDYLKSQGIVAISGVDTRKLTRILRERGAQGACILVGEDADRAVELARGFGGHHEHAASGSVTPAEAAADGEGFAGHDAGGGAAPVRRPARRHRRGRK